MQNHLKKTPGRHAFVYWPYTRELIGGESRSILQKRKRQKKMRKVSAKLNILKLSIIGNRSFQATMFKYSVFYKFDVVKWTSYLLCGHKWRPQAVLQFQKVYIRLKAQPLSKENCSGKHTSSTFLYVMCFTWSGVARKFWRKVTISVVQKVLKWFYGGFIIMAKWEEQL